MEPDVITVKFVTDLIDEDRIILTTVEGEFVVISGDDYRQLKRTLADRLGAPEETTALIGRQFKRTREGLKPAD